MCYTRRGMELTRVTVVDSNERVVYDRFVQPAGEIIDYNTEFSGVTPQDIAASSTTLQDVQSRLIELKLVHSKVVDTSVVFPHKRGLPYKRKLKTLMSELLKKVIQEGDTIEVGHDSSEDAI